MVKASSSTEFMPRVSPPRAKHTCQAFVALKFNDIDLTAMISRAALGPKAKCWIAFHPFSDARRILERRLQRDFGTRTAVALPCLATPAAKANALRKDTTE